MQRIIIRRRPRVLRPLSPFKKGSNPAATIIDVVGEMEGSSQKSERTDRVCGSKLSFPPRPPSSKSSPSPSTLSFLRISPLPLLYLRGTNAKAASAVLREFYNCQLAVWHLCPLEYSYSVGRFIGKALHEATLVHLASCPRTWAM